MLCDLRQGTKVANEPRPSSVSPLRTLTTYNSLRSSLTAIVGLTSAAGVVGFLSEPDYELQIYALHKLNEEIDSLWTEVVDSIGEIEALYEDASFPERELAALAAPKIYCNLREYNESMVFALQALRCRP